MVKFMVNGAEYPILPISKEDMDYIEEEARSKGYADIVAYPSYYCDSDGHRRYYPKPIDGLEIVE